MMDHRSNDHRAFLVLVSATLAACSGGGDATVAPPIDTRVQAATQTALSNAECTKIQPFYWEVGDAAGTLASGASPAGSTTYSATRVLQIASASKWLYGTYWVQRVGGEAGLSADDIRFFNFASGYTYLAEPPGCTSSTTVASCLAQTDTAGHGFGDQDPATVGKFDYGGGHMQVHASNHGLGPLDNAGLAAELRSLIGSEIALGYSQPQLAGGVLSAPQEYAKMLRKILGGQLLMRGALGTHSVCASPGVCPTEAISSPAPRGENWRYSIGHWVEDGTNDSDGAFSSPGAFGFYPWIDKTKSYYGIVARLDLAGALDSVFCGRLIRKAFVTGTAQ